VGHLQLLEGVKLVAALSARGGRDAYATCLDQESLKHGFPQWACVDDAQLYTVYAHRGVDDGGDWTVSTQRAFEFLLINLNEALEGRRILDGPNRMRLCALASAWMSADHAGRLSSKAAVLGGGDSPRLTRAMEKKHQTMLHTGLLALSGRDQGVAILTECSATLFYLSTRHWMGMALEMGAEGGLGDDQLAVEAAVGALVDEYYRVPARLLGLYEIEGEWLRELRMHDRSYMVPERWLRVFLEDYQETPSSDALPVGVMVGYGGRPPMDTHDRLCGQKVSLRRVEQIVVVEPIAEDI